MSADQDEWDPKCRMGPVEKVTFGQRHEKREAAVWWLLGDSRCMWVRWPEVVRVVKMGCRNGEGMGDPVDHCVDLVFYSD